GWGGDRWQLYRRGDDTVTVLATVWDSDRDAREFRAALPRSMRRAALMKGDAVVVVAGGTGDRARVLARAALRCLRGSEDRQEVRSTRRSKADFHFGARVRSASASSTTSLRSY